MNTYISTSYYFVFHLHNDCLAKKIFTKFRKKAMMFPMNFGAGSEGPFPESKNTSIQIKVVEQSLEMLLFHDFKEMTSNII